MVDVQEEREELMERLALTLSNNSNTLKLLSFWLDPWVPFDFEGYPSPGYDKIGKSLSNCSNIEDLVLIYTESLKSEDIVKTFQGIQNMKKMKSLKLKIKASDSINAEVLPTLKSMLASVSNVEKLHLTLGDFKALTDKDVKDFMAEVSNLHSLTDFRLELRNVPKLTQESLKFTVDVLKGLNALKIGGVDFTLEQPKQKFAKGRRLTMPSIFLKNKSIHIRS